MDDIGSRPGVRKDFPSVKVNKSGIYYLHGDTQFDKDLKKLQNEGTRKDEAHISLD